MPCCLVRACWMGRVHDALTLCRHAGEVLFGTDSHTCNAGAFGQFATGVGNTDAGFILGTGKLLIKVLPCGDISLIDAYAAVCVALFTL